MRTSTRVRIYIRDYDGSESQRTFVTYVDSIEEANAQGWKWELA